jgi:transposase-like protein
MTYSNDETPLPTCPDCGATRSRDAVPYASTEGGVATFTCAGCGGQFESWITTPEAETPPSIPASGDSGR